MGGFNIFNPKIFFVVMHHTRHVWEYVYYISMKPLIISLVIVLLYRHYMFDVSTNIPTVCWASITMGLSVQSQVLKNHHFNW